MPLIKPLVREKRKTLSLHLDEPVYERFVQYCEMLGGDSTHSYVAQQMIERVLASDRDFSAYLASLGAPAVSVKPARRPKAAAASE